MGTSAPICFTSPLPLCENNKAPSTPRPTIGIVISEMYKFFTWHIMNITGKMSIQNSMEFAFPEFYVGVVISLIMIFVYLCIDKIVKE